ncbi:hypothetical protein P9112_005258 [Eukaryota sp. TZLM1-RC]
MTQTASLINGPKDHNNNAPSSLRKSNVPFLKENNPPPPTVSKPPSTESSPSLGKRASPQNESNHVNLSPGYDPNNMLPYGAKLVPGKGTDTELFVKPVDGEGTRSSNPNSPPSDTGEPKEKDQPVTTVTSQQGEDNPNDSDGDGNGDEPPRCRSSSADWTDTEYRTSQEWYRKQLREKVTLVVQEFLLNIRASPPNDIRDWSVDEFVKAIETEANVFSDPSYVGDRDEFLKKRWPFLFGSSRGYTMVDVVHQEQDQSPDMLTKLDQCSESAVQYVAEDPENCYFENPRSKYQTATPKPQFWHNDAIPDQRIRARNQYSLGNELEVGRMFWIAKMYPHHQAGHPWIVKHKAWVDSYPDQRVFENVLVKSSCLPYKHHVNGVPQNSKDAPDWAIFEPDTQKLPEQDDPPKYRQIINLSEMLPSEEANQLLFSTPSVAPYLGRRQSSAQASGHSTPVPPTIPLVASSPSTNIPRDPLVLSSGVYTKPFTDEEKLIKKIDEKKRQLKKLDDGFEYSSFNLTNNSCNFINKMSKIDSNYKHLNPLKRFRESSNLVGSIHSVRLSRVTGDQVSSNGELWLTCSINNVEVQGEIDNGAAFSALSMDLALKCRMTIDENKTVEYLSANGIPSTTLGSANGVLALNVGSLATQMYLRIEFQIIPGTSNFLIGRDLLQTLGLRTVHGINISLDREHHTILNAECEFDDRICQPVNCIDLIENKTILGNSIGHSTFKHYLDELSCRICMDDIRDEERLVLLLEEYRDVFSGLPHPDGIDCQPMTIAFYDESKIVKRKPRRLNPEKQRVPEEFLTN